MAEEKSLITELPKIIERGKKEAKARIKINKLLEDSGWRF